MKKNVWENENVPTCYVYVVTYKDNGIVYEYEPFKGQWFFTESSLSNHIRKTELDITNLNDIISNQLTQDCYCNLYRKHIRKYLFTLNYKTWKKGFRIFRASWVRWLQWNIL